MIFIFVLIGAKSIHTSSAGIIGAVAKDFFNSEITMEIVNQLEEQETAGTKEHVVFQVTPAGAPRSGVASGETGCSPTAQPLQPLTNRCNTTVGIKEVRLIIYKDNHMHEFKFELYHLCVLSPAMKRDPVSVAPCRGVTGRQLRGWFTLVKV